jgi:hypothetical protein
MLGQHVVACDVGHEAQPPLVDADQRDLVTCQMACGVEHGAVAAEDDRHVGMRAQPGKTAACPAAQVKLRDHVARRLLLDQDRHATFVQVSGQHANRFGNIPTVVLADQRDGLGQVARNQPTREETRCSWASIKPQFSLLSAAPREREGFFVESNPC